MKTLTVSCVVLLMVSMAMAQTAPFERNQRFPGWSLDQLKDYLGLTDQQIDNMKSIQKSQMEAMKPISQEIGRLCNDLRAESKKSRIDSARIDKLRAEIARLSNDLQAMRTFLQQELLKMLVTQQKAALAKLEEVLKLQAAALQAASLGLIEGPGGFTGEPCSFTGRFMGGSALDRPVVHQPAPRFGSAPARRP